MASWSAEIRRREAEARRLERETQKRHRELERRIKERAKLSELEQARLDVEAHQNDIDLLLSVHKEQSDPIDWPSLASALAPHRPLRTGLREFAAILHRGISKIGNSGAVENAIADRAHELDEEAYKTAFAAYELEAAECKRLRALARRVLSGEAGAYVEAITEFSGLGELSHIGSSMHFTVRSPNLIECVLTVNGTEVIPKEVKSLTAAKKLSVKAMPKGRFHEIYQDYVCGCVLRLAREVFALLPVGEVLVTASVIGLNAKTGLQADLPVLSVAMARAFIEKLDFERLDPSDSMENFPHRGDVKASRKSGEFVPIIPLTPEDLAPARPERMDFTGLLTHVRQLREDISSQMNRHAATDDQSTESLAQP